MLSSITIKDIIWIKTNKNKQFIRLNYQSKSVDDQKQFKNTCNQCTLHCFHHSNKSSAQTYSSNKMFNAENNLYEHVKMVPWAKLATMVAVNLLKVLGKLLLFISVNSMSTTSVTGELIILYYFIHL